jgi:hypothetical protein
MHAIARICFIAQHIGGRSSLLVAGARQLSNIETFGYPPHGAKWLLNCGAARDEREACWRARLLPIRLSLCETASGARQRQILQQLLLGQ